ncbi:MAG: phosphomannomutase [Nitrososphaeraceae archaeon]
MKISVSGVRGIYGGDLTLHNISKFTRLFASSLIKPEGGCVLASDTRPSSRLISQFVAANLMEQGIHVYNLGVAPTPVVFRESRKYAAGIVITASHNPLQWNGLKFIINGRGVFEDEVNFIFNEKSVLKPAKFGKYFDISSDYVDQVAHLTSKKQVKSKARVGLDPGGGAACGYCNELFKQLGHTFYSVNDISGLSSRNPDPTADGLSELRILVSSNNLDFGFAFDLDGDRLVVINSQGEKLSADSTLLLCVANAISMGMKKFVSSIDTSLSIEKYIHQNGCSLYYSKVGEANVVKKMLDTDADAGGEGSSAGFIMPKFNMCRDGFLASSIISSSERKLIDECLNFSSQYLQLRSVVFVDSSLHIKVINKLRDVLKAEASEILILDGVKAILDDDSWILVRPSNTEDAIRISVESKTQRAKLLFKRTSERIQTVYDQVK